MRGESEGGEEVGKEGERGHEGVVRRGEGGEWGV